MLPAEGEKRQIFSNSAIADGLTTFSSSKLFGSIDDLRRRLDLVKLDDVANTDHQIRRVVTRLKQFEAVFEILATVRQCQSEAKLAVEGNVQALDQSRSGAISRPQPILGRSKLIDLPKHEKPKSESSNRSVQAAQTTLSVGPGSALALNALVSKIEFVIPPTDDFKPGSTCGEQVACARELTANDRLPPITGAGTVSLPTLIAHAHNMLIGHQPAVEEHSDSNHAAELVSGDQPQAAGLVTSQGIETRIEMKLPDIIEFDTKLLNDLIKNYGEFVANPNLPATAQSSPPDASKSSEADLGSVALVRSNELDRQFTKLILDYGEGAPFFQIGALKTKLRVAGALIVLAALLGGIYYGSASKSASIPPASFWQSAPDGASKKGPK